MKTLRGFGTAAWLLCLLLIVLPAAGQESPAVDLPETFTFDSGTRFNYPEDGEVDPNEVDPAFVSVTFGDALVFVMDFPAFEKQDFTADTALIDVAEWYIDAAPEIEFDPELAQETDIDEREALTYVYESEDEEWLLVLVRFEDGTIAALDSTGADEETILAMAASIEPAADAETEAAAVSCVVSTEQSNTVQLRVGPGTNRTVFAFLPAGTEFTPLGQAEADDGSLWFQLDKAEAAPASAAAEAWVAAEDVDTSGNCDALGEADAPPVVPIIPSTSSGTGGTAGSLPAAGAWTATIGGTGQGSCLGTTTVDVPVEQVTQPSEVIHSGRNIIVDGNLLRQVQPGMFVGLFTMPEGEVIQIVLRAVSATHMVGEGNITAVVEGHQCSVGVPITLTKN